MTIAIDKRTGKPCGQVTTVRRFLTPKAYAPGASALFVTLLTREGYKTVPRASVRLEEVE